MRLPIPDDWDGQSWFCLQTQWPDSPQWVALLIGALTLYTRGRYWDEKTGSILDAKEIGQDIFDRNYPFNLCDGNGVPSEPDQDVIHVISGSSGLDLFGEELMSLCGYNPNAFKIEDGTLYVKDFCGEWQSIGALKSTNEDPPPDVWEDPDQEGTYYSCGKVNYLIDQFVLFSDAVWDHVSNPFTFEQQVRNAVSDSVNLHRARLYQWMTTLITIDAFADKEHFNDPEMIANAKCNAATTVAATSEGTDAEVDIVVNALGAAMTAKWGSTWSLQYLAYWVSVMDTFGRLDCRLLLSLGATDDTATCQCWSTAEQAKWQFTGSWTADVENTGQINSVDVLDGGRRVEIEIEYDADEGFGTVSGLNLEITGSEANDEPLVRVYPKVGTLHVPDATWIVQDEPTTSDQWFHMSIAGEAGETTVRVNGSGYADLSIEDGVGLATDLICVGLRQHKDGAAGPGNVWQFVIEILGVNGDNLTPIGPGA